MYTFLFVVFQVPELAGSWLLTLLIQLPLILFLLLNSAAIILPLEWSMNLLLTIFIVFEIVVGYFSIRTMVNYQVTKFHLQQFTDLEQIPQYDAYAYAETAEQDRAR